MRARCVRLIAVSCGLVAVAAPGVANAAPEHDRGLTIAATPSPIIAGEGVLVYGALRGPADSGQTVRLYHRINPASSFTLIGRARTDATGFYEFTRAEGDIITNRSWFVRGPDGAHSRTIHEQVAPLITLDADTTAAATRLPVVLSGSIAPNHRSQAVLLQEQAALDGNGWKTIASGFTNGASTFSMSHTWALPGSTRCARTSQPTHATSPASPTP